MHNPNRWKGAHRMKLADADEAIMRLNPERQIDGTPGRHAPARSVLQRHAANTPLPYPCDYPHLFGLCDVPRGGVESASAAMRLIVRALLAWGVPETIIKTMSHQLLAMLLGYAGHNVAERQALHARRSCAARFGAPARQIFSVKFTPGELQEKLDTWVQHLYGNRPHQGLGLTETLASQASESTSCVRTHKSPNQLAAEWTGEVRHIANERALAVIAEEAMARRIGRDGIRIAGVRFVPDTASVDGYVAHIGEAAPCFPDPSGDMGHYLLFLETSRGREFIAPVKNSERRGLDRGALVPGTSGTRSVHPHRPC
jgi:hypothetical protein